MEPDVTATAQREPPVPLAEEPAPLDRGTCVGRYVVIDKLGQGGMGVVYKAYDPELDRPIALKLLRPRSAEAGGTNSVLRDRLLREAKALARLAHPNVIAIHDVGTFEQNVFLAMEFVAGQTLRAWLRERPRTIAEIVATFVAAGEGLAAAHRAGLVHRDFKPDNVIVGEDGRVRVLDFGLARAAVRDVQLPAPETAVLADERPAQLADGSQPAAALPADVAVPASNQTVVLPTETAVIAPSDEPADDNSKTTPLPRISASSGRPVDARLTAAGAIMGTPAYMAPEQHTGRGESTHTDQWSFCTALYEALYGVHPFAGTTVAELRRAVLAGEIVPPPADSRVPRRYRQVLLRGLQTTGSARYPSMDVLLADLRRDPRATRRAVIAGAVVLVLAGGATAAALELGSREDLVCAGAAAKLDGIWDAQRKRAVQDAFAATRMPYHADAFRGVQRALDRYATGWVGMHTETCRATRVLGEQSEELLDLRMRCLAQRRDELAAKVELFAAADVAVVEKAVPAAEALTRLDGCADADALRAPLRPPAEASARAKVDAVRSEVTRAKALEEIGKFKDGLKLAEAALGKARELAYRPVEAEAAHILGALRERAGDYAGAARAFSDALVAAHAGRHDEIAAQVYVALVGLLGDRQGKFDEAAETARLAEASVERLGGWELLVARLRVYQGTVSYRRGLYQEALAQHLVALATFERLSPTHPSYGGALASVAEDYRALARLDEARTYYERALSHRRTLLGPAHPLLGATLSNLGNVLADRGDHDGALAHYRSALEIWEPSLGEDHPYIAATLNNAADELRILGRYDEAFSHLQRAAALWEKRLGKDHPEMAVAHHNLGDLHRARHQYKEALAEYDRSLAIRAVALGTNHPNYAVTLSARAEVMLDLGRPDAARADHRRALAVVEKALGPSHPDVLDILIALARTYLADRAAAQALPLLERVVASAEAEPGDGTRLAEARFELARAVAGAGGDRTRAVDLARQARDAWMKAGARGEAKIAAIDAWLAATN